MRLISARATEAAFNLLAPVLAPVLAAEDEAAGAPCLSLVT